MLEFIEDAGYGIYPVFFFGGLALALGAFYLARPRGSTRSLVVGLSFATLLAGLLGTVAGLQTTVRAVQSMSGDEFMRVFLVGLRESLNCTFAALVIAIVATLLATAGSFRLRRGQTAALAPQPAPAR
ncbi:MAG: MotA/TolQ/ExbB proton channel family protein [Myxococcales bacterium]